MSLLAGKFLQCLWANDISKCRWRVGIIQGLKGWLFWIYTQILSKKGFPGGSVVKNLPAKLETRVWSLGREDALEKEMATHSSILAWEIPWTKEPGGL